ncbi:unnamed protein product [Bursaphelenchus xylophilus]|uniref:(pine wood nematode) hypothetical protein n=1 Tax=Bursaphelenchus xylophilus TaxID=6326 RepID=A0A1I7S373_BURXY|nr:unnamed protein product [Bursaphelenchus xylophilus]CAG9116119.1 unnamed protein product [Bursaphelenchus xylophilus]
MIDSDRFQLLLKLLFYVMNTSHRKRSIEVTGQEALDIVNQSVSSAKKILLETSYENKAFITELQVNLGEEENGANDFDEKDELKEKKFEKETRRKSKLRRSISVPNLLESLDQKAPASQRRATTTLIPQALNESKDISISNWDSFDGCRAHEFCSTRVKKMISAVECASCNTPIKFGSMSKKCNACKLSFHSDCIQKVGFPCLPKKETPKSLYGKGRLRLGDYCPDDRPMIPHLVGHCVLYLERCEVPEDLYEGFGDEECSSKLLAMFKKSKSIPKLTGFQMNDVAGCLKRFLADIREPLIQLPETQEFVSASTEEDGGSKLLELVQGLPHPHCDTIVYLVKHWKRLGEGSFHGFVEPAALCRRVGPVAMGVGRPTCEVTEEEAAGVFLALMKIPMESWTGLEVESNAQSLSRKSSQQSHELTRFTSSINILN